MFIKNLAHPSFRLPTLFFGFVVFTQGISLSWAQSASVDELIAEGAKPELLAGGFKFTEGPATDASGNLYFTDIGGNCIHCWNTSTRTLSTLRENSGGADGLFVGRDGTLWLYVSDYIANKVYRYPDCVNPFWWLVILASCVYATETANAAKVVTLLLQ